MGKTSTSDIESGVGFLGGFLSTLMGHVRENKIPFEAIHRLGKAGGKQTVKKIVDLAYADWQDEQPAFVEATADRPQQPEMGEPLLGGSSYRNAPTNNDKLPANHYSVRVTYAPMPSFADLKKEFGENNVSVIFDGREWKLDSSCVGMDRTPGVKIFLVHDFGRAWESEEAIAWGLAERTAVAPNGYRPATHEEKYEFQKAHPELFNYVALGSFTFRGDVRCVAGLWHGGGRRFLDSGAFDRRWDARYRCLFVSKASS